jgi:hypothetical protein
VLDEVLPKVAGDLTAGLRRFVTEIRMYGGQLCFGPHSQLLCRLNLMRCKRGGKEVARWGPASRFRPVTAQLPRRTACRHVRLHRLEKFLSSRQSGEVWPGRFEKVLERWYSEAVATTALDREDVGVW